MAYVDASIKGYGYVFYETKSNMEYHSQNEIKIDILSFPERFSMFRP